MDWIVRNLSLLAFLLALVAAVGAVLRLRVVFALPELLLSELFVCALTLVGIAVSYGILLRFLALCDDITALRKTQTGTPSSLD